MSIYIKQYNIDPTIPQHIKFNFSVRFLTFELGFLCISPKIKEQTAF